MSTVELEISRSSSSTRMTSIAIAVVAAVLASAPMWASTDMLRLLIDVFLYAALACLWNFLAGYAGLVSVGQQAFVGLGGYGLFALAKYSGLPPFLCVVLVSGAVALVSIPFASLLFRLRGAYFAIGSWVLAEVLRLVAQLTPPVGGASGMSLPIVIAQSLGPSPQERYATVYLAALTLFAVIFAGIFYVMRSRLGLALTAIRDNELAARASGIDVDRTKLIVYVATAAGTAATGALIFLQRLRISPDAAFSVNDWTALVIFMVVIGGVGSIEGPLIGVIVFFILREFLSTLGPIYLMSLGAVAIAIMMFYPRGLWGYVRGRWQIQLLPLHLRVERPTRS